MLLSFGYFQGFLLDNDTVPYLFHKHYALGNAKVLDIRLLA